VRAGASSLSRLGATCAAALAGLLLSLSAPRTCAARTLGSPVDGFPPNVAPEAKERLVAAASDPVLASWQREVMKGLADNGEWSVIQPQGASKHAAIYDPLRNRVLVFGGADGSSAGVKNETWELSLVAAPVWRRLATQGAAPAPRWAHSATYDPPGNRMIVFGGSVGGIGQGDTWALSLQDPPTWTQLQFSGPTPDVRLGHSAVYDPVRNRILIFGGWNQGGPRNDVWALPLSGTPEWAEIIPSGTSPPGRSRHAAIYDLPRDRMVIFGGLDAGNAPQSDAWSLPLGEDLVWTQLAPGGPLPAARYNHGAEYDPVRDRIVVFGGYDGIFHMNDLWALSLDGAHEWSPLSSQGGPPDPRSGHGAIYDPIRDRMILVWGHNPTRFWNDTWELALGDTPQWSVVPPGAIPYAGLISREYDSVYDPVRDRVVVVVSPSDLSPVEAWTLSLAPVPLWSRLIPTGTPPSGRAGCSVIYDPPRDRLILFGGTRLSAALNDVWTLSLSGALSWAEIVPDGGPPAVRWYHAAIYDPVRDRMVIHGGGSEGLVYRRDAWVLSLAGAPAWSQLSPAGTKPLGRIGHTAIYDPSGDRMIVHGGRNQVTLFGDIWALSLDGATAWAQVLASGNSPGSAASHSAVYDPIRERMAVFGGSFQPPDPGATYTLSLSGSPSWTRLSPSGQLPPGTRTGHGAVYDPARDRMIVIGGYTYFDDAWPLCGAPRPEHRGRSSRSRRASPSRPPGRTRSRSRRPSCFRSLTAVGRASTSSMPRAAACEFSPMSSSPRDRARSCGTGSTTMDDECRMASTSSAWTPRGPRSRGRSC